MSHPHEHTYFSHIAMHSLALMLPNTHNVGLKDKERVEKYVNGRTVLCECNSQRDTLNSCWLCCYLLILLFFFSTHSHLFYSIKICLLLFLAHTYLYGLLFRVAFSIRCHSFSLPFLHSMHRHRHSDSRFFPSKASSLLKTIHTFMVVYRCIDV